MNPALGRRGFALGAAALAAALPMGIPGLRSGAARAQALSPGPYTLPPLPYAFTANEPHVDAQTMELHHDKHHAAYVNNLNAALKDHGQLAALPLQQLLARIDSAPESIRTALRNNGGGHANHSMFWEIMGGKGGAPSGELGAAIERDFGGFDKFKSEFNRRGGARFGSGWVFVTVARDGKLGLTDMPNQDSPLMSGQMVLMGNDVWEHAYYLKYQNRRPEYLQAWWNVVDWDKVAQRHAAAKSGSLTI